MAFPPVNFGLTKFNFRRVGWENSIAFITYSNRFRAHRKQTAQVLGSKVAVSRFNLLQEVEVGRFLLRMLESPNDLPEHTKTEAGAIILKIAYGYTIEPHGIDPLVALAEKSFKEFGKAAVPGAWVVDMVQFLRYLPDWFPGAGFKRTARQWRATLTDLTERPYAFVKHQMAQGKHESSFLSQLLGSGDLDDEETSVARWSALSLYGGGARTTISSMSCFFLAMTAFPAVQRKAQEEIDRNVGTGRLPGFQDRQNLPYIDAIVKEVLRWHPVAPMGLPHMTTEDDICEGYLIPKGALLLPNIWGFAHNPDVYHEPMEFKPERFLPTDGSLPEPDPHKLSFGFGRRICPGQFLADSSLFLNIAQILAVFQVNKPIENGQVIEPSVNFLPGVVSHPAPFRTSVVPRSQQHEALIRSFEQIHPWEKGDAEILEKVTY